MTVLEANDEPAAGVHEVMDELDNLRDRSNRVAETTDDIVAEAETQERIVQEPSDRVHEPSAGAAGDDCVRPRRARTDGTGAVTTDGGRRGR